MSWILTSRGRSKLLSESDKKETTHKEALADLIIRRGIPTRMTHSSDGDNHETQLHYHRNGKHTSTVILKSKKGPDGKLSRSAVEQSV